jgi:hypothetical protein
MHQSGYCLDMSQRRPRLTRLTLCLVPALLLAVAVHEAPARAGAPRPVLEAPPPQPASSTSVLTADLDGPDSTCNYEVSPSMLVADEGTNAQLEISVPTGVTLTGWVCVEDVCKMRLSEQTIAEYGPLTVVLEVDVGDPARLGGAHVIVGTPDQVDSGPHCIWWPNGTYHCDGDGDYYPPICCACPCDFAPKCF